MLKTLPAFADVRMRDLLPLKIEGADEGCPRGPETEIRGREER